MKIRALIILTLGLMMAGCDDAKKAGDETARELTGANMIEQGKKTQQQLRAIEQQQQQRYDELEQE